MKAATRTRLKVLYIVFAPLFLLLCLGAIASVVLTARHAFFAAPLLVPTAIAARNLRRCSEWLRS